MDFVIRVPPIDGWHRLNRHRPDETEKRPNRADGGDDLSGRAFKEIYESRLHRACRLVKHREKWRPEPPSLINGTRPATGANVSISALND